MPKSEVSDDSWIDSNSDHSSSRGDHFFRENNRSTSTTDNKSHKPRKISNTHGSVSYLVPADLEGSMGSVDLSEIGLVDRLEFESWWIERNIRRKMIVLYYTDKEMFEIIVDDSIVPLSVLVVNRNDQPLQVWDLHVGAVVDILGKPTSLMKASVNTVNWLDKQALKLYKKKVKLEVRIGYYLTLSLIPQNN